MIHFEACRFVIPPTYSKNLIEDKEHGTTPIQKYMSRRFLINIESLEVFNKTETMHTYTVNDNKWQPIRGDDGNFIFVCNHFFFFFFFFFFLLDNGYQTF